MQHYWKSTSFQGLVGIFNANFLLFVRKMIHSKSGNVCAL